MLDKKMLERIKMVQELLANTKTVPVVIRREEYQVEYLVIPAITKEGAKKPPIFNYPGGLTHLAPCIEPFIYLDRESIHISPLGYGKSSDVSDKIFTDHPLHGAEVGRQVLKTLQKKNIILYGHSNAAPIIVEMAIRTVGESTTVQGIILVNPVGIRNMLKLWAALAFPIFGALSRILSWGSKHPFDFLEKTYNAPKHLFSRAKVEYELDKSCKARLPEMFRQMRARGLKIPVNVIQSKWDWGKFHWPWQNSNEQILREYIPMHLLSMEEIPGLHNVTLGKDSKKLADILEKSLLTVSSLAFIFSPQIPVFAGWLVRGFGIA